MCHFHGVAGGGVSEAHSPGLKRTIYKISSRHSVQLPSVGYGGTTIHGGKRTIYSQIGNNEYC